MTAYGKNDEAEQRAAPNRRSRFPLGGLMRFEYCLCAPPATPAAVGEAQRWVASRVYVWIIQPAE